ADATAGGTTTIEHGSFRDAIPRYAFDDMVRKNIAYDPTLSVVDARAQVHDQNLSLLDRSLLQQAAPRLLLTSTRKALSARAAGQEREAENFSRALKTGQQNLAA